MIPIINKSLLEAETKYIVHQCNCISKNSAGLAKAIFDKYPYANTYSTRKEFSKLGNIDILGSGKEQRFIINAYIQHYPGKSNWTGFDSKKERLFWLQSCLSKIEKIENIKSIGLPEGMGCCLAGNNWQDVLPILEDFAYRIKKNQNAETYLYKYDSIKSNTQESLKI